MTSEALEPTRVSFDSEGDELVGDLYLPPAPAGGGRLPALVVTGSWTTVKEQMAGLYARRLAERGFAALAFDFRGFGESAGEPRAYESPARKAQDIHNAVTFLASRPELDAARLGAVGVCASSGYTAVNAARDERVRSLVLIAPWLHDGALVRALYGGDEGVRQRIEAGEAAHERYEQSGEAAHVPAISTTDESAAMFGEFDYYLNSERGAIPEWPNHFAVMSWPEWLGFDPIRVAPEILAPTLLVHSPDAAVPDGARRFHRDLGGPADFLWTQGTQFDFYDQEPQVTVAVDAAEAHLRRTLDLPGAAERSTSVAVVERFFAALEAMDVDAFLEVWADDAVQEMPFAPDGFPSRLDGKEDVRRQYGGLPEAYEGMRFPRQLHPTTDPAVVIAEYEGSIALRAGGRYDNRYIGVFEVRDGRLRRFVEYFNPEVLAAAFGGEQLGQTFGLGDPDEPQG